MKKYTWDIIVTYFIGLSLGLFCIYIAISDITFLSFSKTGNPIALIFNDPSNTVSFKYVNGDKTISISDKKVEKPLYDLLKLTSPTLTYNPYFPEQVYLDKNKIPNWGEVLIFISGIWLIFFLMNNAVKTLRPKNEKN